MSIGRLGYGAAVLKRTVSGSTTIVSLIMRVNTANPPGTPVIVAGRPIV